MKVSQTMHQAGAEAVRRCSKKAQEFYSKTDPLDIAFYDEAYFISLDRGQNWERLGSTIKELDQGLCDYADAIKS